MIRGGGGGTSSNASNGGSNDGQVVAAPKAKAGVPDHSCEEVDGAEEDDTKSED